MERQKTLPLRSPACPYCGEVQTPPPQRRKKCRDCGQLIYVEKGSRYRRLVTEKEAKERESAEREKRWKELSKQLNTALQAKDWNMAGVAYDGQAAILFAEGRGHHRVAQEAQKCQLRAMQEIGIRNVEILTGSDERVCPYCRSLEGKVFSIKKALEQMPIPGSQCRDGSERNPHGGRCRCIYLAVVQSQNRAEKSSLPKTATKIPDQGAQGCLVLIILMLLLGVAVAY